MLSKKIDIAILLIIAINVVLISTWFKSANHLYKQYQKAQYKLGTVDQVGYAGVKVSYDKEPVDIEIITPSGKIFSKKNSDIYEINENEKNVLALVDTTETGDWYLNIKQKSNKKINYAFITRPSTTIYLENVNIETVEDNPYLTFVPVMSTENKNKCKYSIILKSKTKSFILTNGETALNKKAYVLIDPDRNAFDGDIYQLELSVEGIDGIKNEKISSANKTISIILPKHETTNQESKKVVKEET